MINRVIQITNLDPNKKRRNSNNMRVYWPKGVAACLHEGGGWKTPLFMVLRSKMYTEQQDSNNRMEHKSKPTKEDLINYFGDRVAIRKMHPTEAFRLMDVSDEDIEKIQAYPWHSFLERDKALEGNNEMQRKKALRCGISKTAQYRLAGNSIVVSCLYHIFKNLFIPKFTAEPISNLN